MGVLAIGSSGSEVIMLQRALSFLGYTITIDGSFGPGTQAVVIKFQTDHGLSTDGTVGPNTWAILNSLAPQGMDISHGNGPIDWDNLSPQIQFVYCKYSQGSTFKDPMYAANVAAIKQKGLIMGPYHFLTFQTSAQAQVDNFMGSGIDFSAPGILPPALDIEWQVGNSDTATNNLNNYILNNKAACVQLISDWLTLVAAKTGRIPVIYTAKGFWNEYLSGITQFGNYPLWIPAYQPAPPGLPPGWNNYSIWQYSGAGAIDGVSGDVDQDLFNGNQASLQALAKITS